MGALYPIVRPVARYVLSRFYRQIDITGLEHIPREGAVILAANHPTAFIEPCVMACFQPRNLHFLARGDLYKNRAATLVLSALNILPVYRIQDGGFGKLRNNFETFDECFRVLGQGKAIMILAEGACVHEKKLRPLRKGTARIALGALAADPTLKEVHVIPVGVNFTAADSARSTILIRCGEPIAASRWLKDYRLSATPALTDFTRHLRQRLAPLVIQLPDHEPLRELNLEMVRSDMMRRKGLTHSGVQLDRELTAAVATIDVTASSQLATHLRDHQLDLGAVAGAINGSKSTGLIKSQGWHLCKMSVGYLLQLPLLPLLLLTNWIAETKVNTVEFYQPVRFAALAISLITIVPAALLLLIWPLKVWIVFSLLTLGTTLNSQEQWKAYRALRKWERLPERDRKAIARLYGAVREKLPAE